MQGNDEDVDNWLVSNNTVLYEQDSFDNGGPSVGAGDFQTGTQTMRRSSSLANVLQNRQRGHSLSFSPRLEPQKGSGMGFDLNLLDDPNLSMLQQGEGVMDMNAADDMVLESENQGFGKLNESGKRKADYGVGPSSTSSSSKKRFRKSRVEHEVQLLERNLVTLEKENDVLLEQIKSKTPPHEVLNEKKRDIMKKLGSAARRGTKTLPKHLDTYLENCVTDPDKWTQLTENLEDMMDELEPTIVLKMLLWALLQDDKFYARGEDQSPIWRMICEVMEADQNQQDELKSLSVQAKLVTSQLNGAKKQLEKIVNTIHERKHGMEKLKTEVFKILSKRQYGQLISHMECSTRTKSLIELLSQHIGLVPATENLPLKPERYFDPDQSWKSEHRDQNLHDFPPS